MKFKVNQVFSIILILFVFGLKVFGLGNEFYQAHYADFRDVMVHLFEWRWEDIANECETFLGPMKYAGVQVSPPNENAIIENPPFNPKARRPWYERYQPVSYRLETRSGTEEEFKDMVRRCNNVGVRIYVDAVINHMTGSLPRGTKGTAGSQFDSETFSYPAVPFGPNDFNSEENCGGDPVKATHDCQLVQLKDLNQRKDWVRKKIREYFNHLLDIGVAGFRIDAAKHMWPSDLKEIYKDLTLSTKFFPPNCKPLIFQEVISYDDRDVIDRSEYTRLARVTEFRYGEKLSNCFRGNDQLRWLRNFGEEWSFVASDDALVFVDNHDNQRSNDGNVLTFFEPEKYKKALSFMMAWPYGLKRIISSYKWERSYNDGHDENDWVGPPHDDRYNILPVRFNHDGSCRNGWVCEHRWPSVARMVQFSIISKDEPVTDWWDNGGNQIAFSRGNKAFYAVNNDNSLLEAEISTQLPPGRYCDVISGELIQGKCTGRLVTVDYDRKINLKIPQDGDESVLAIHIEAKEEDFESKYPLITEDSIPGGNFMQRTVILVHRYAENKDPLTIEGRVNHKQRESCDKDPQLCEIAIILDGQETVLDSSQNSDLKLVWTTNDRSGDEFSGLNKYGPDYYVLDVFVDCSRTHYGWFDVKFGTSDGKSERNVEQDEECTGDVWIRKPYETENHIALCGKINVFRFGKGNCIIQYFHVDPIIYF